MSLSALVSLSVSVSVFMDVQDGQSYVTGCHSRENAPPPSPLLSLGAQVAELCYRIAQSQEWPT